MSGKTVDLKKSDIQQIFLFDDGTGKHIIYLFKDGSAKSCGMTTNILASTLNAGIPVISVGSL